MIALDKLSSSSELFKRYLNSQDFIDEFFPANNQVFNNPDYLNSIADNQYRHSTIKSIAETMNVLELSSEQKKNLELLAKPNSLAVITGQQIGFLGGPLYTFYKIASCINWAEKFKTIYKQFEFIPIFWVEDNDHDLVEASIANIYDKNNTISEVNCFTDINRGSRKIVGSIKFDESIVAIIDNIIELLPHSRYKDNAESILKEIYYTGESLTNAFIKLLNKYYSDSGLLFISANKAVENGLFKSTAIFEIENCGLSAIKIDYMNEKLSNQNLHIQAKHTDVNLFYHIDNERHKINYNKSTKEFSILDYTYSKNQLLDLVNKEPENFSPGALLRPIFQDTILPTSAYIAGAGEIAYSSQIRELYPLFGIRQGAVINRHHFVLLSPKINRILNKYSKAPDYFFRPFTEIEKELLEDIKAKDENNVLESAKVSFAHTMENVKKYAVTIDTNLENTATATLHNILKQFENVEKKVNSAIKKSNEDTINKYKEASSWLFPNGVYQERVFSLITLILLESEHMNLIHKHLSFYNHKDLSVFNINIAL